MRATSPMLVFVLALIATGCTTEPTRFYLLDSGAPLTGGKTSGGLVLGVESVTLPEYLERTEIVTRKTAHRLNVAIFDVWAEPLEVNVTRVLADGLGRGLPASRVILLADESADADAVLEVSIDRFERQAHGDVLLTASWFVENGESGATVIARDASLREAVAGEGYDAIVAAMSRALDRLSQEIAAEVDNLTLADFDIQRSRT